MERADVRAAVNTGAGGAPHTANGTAKDTGLLCRYKKFLDDHVAQDGEATAANVVFDSGDVLVSEEGGVRNMLFRRSTQAGTCVQEATMGCRGTVADENCGAKGRCRAESGATPSLSYARSMLGAALVLRPTASRALLIGVGGGMVPLYLGGARPGLSLDAVDISEDVLDAAHCLGLDDAGPSVRLHRADGREFLEGQPSFGYDIIFLDAFTREGLMPPCLSTVEFFSLCAKKLGSGGVLVFNTGAASEHASLLETVRASGFEAVQEGQAPGESNLIVAASLTPLTAPASDRLAAEGPDAWFLAGGFAVPSRASGAEMRTDMGWCSGR